MINFEHRAALNIDVVLRALFLSSSSCVRWGFRRRVCRSVPAHFQTPGRREQIQESTISRTGRNGAAPAIAESIIDSMRSVLARISALDRIDRVRLLGKHIEYRMRSAREFLTTDYTIPDTNKEHDRGDHDSND